MQIKRRERQIDRQTYEKTGVNEREREREVQVTYFCYQCLCSKKNLNQTEEQEVASKILLKGWVGFPLQDKKAKKGK